MRVVRNPFFKEWSKDAQPEGLPDVIDQKFGLSVEAEVTQVENGQADWIVNADSIPADRLPELEHEVLQAAAHQPAAGDLLHGVEHQRAAVRQPEGAPGASTSRPTAARS